MEANEAYARIRRGVVAAARSLGLAVLSLTVAVPLLALTVVSLVLSVVGIGMVTLPAVTAAVRQFADLHRRLARRWAGVDIPTPYRRTGAELPRSDSATDAWRAYLRVLTDPATWRDLAWLLVNATLGFAMLVVSASLFFGSIFYLIYPFLWSVTPRGVFDNAFGFITLDTFWETFSMWPVAGSAMTICAAKLNTAWIVGFVTPGSPSFCVQSTTYSPW